LPSNLNSLGIHFSSHRISLFLSIQLTLIYACSLVLERIVPLDIAALCACDHYMS
jgi:hypothetical protein